MLKTNSKNYDKLLKINQKIAHYESILSLLYWDDRVCMNPESAPYRGKQIAIITEYIHKTKNIQNLQQSSRITKPRWLSQILSTVGKH